MTRNSVPRLRSRLVPLLFVTISLAACGSNDDGSAETQAPDRTDVSDALADLVGDTPQADTVEDSGEEPAEDAPAPDVAADTPEPDTGPDATLDAEPELPPQLDVSDATIVTITTLGAENLPPLFAVATATDAEGPPIVYPTNQTLMPRNVSAPVFQWEGPEGGRYRLRVYTPTVIFEVHTTSWSWAPTQEEWSNIVTRIRDEELVLEVAEVDSSNRLVTGPPSSISFSTANVDGAVYYWAPTANGIVRLPVGDPRPEPFLSGTIFNCVGCHALSPDGSRLAYTRSSGGTPIGTLGVIGTGDEQIEYIATGSFSLYYPSFAPDNIRLAAARGSDVVVLNTDTAEIEHTLSSMPGTSANFPAWSPEADNIVFSAGTSTGMGMDSLGASEAGLARVERTDDGWGEAEWLLERGEAGGMPENLFYPSYSPDGRWVAFNRSAGGAAVGGSPADAALWMVNGRGGTAYELEAANDGFGGNSWPKWAPTSGDGTLWLAFTSARPYGRLGSGQPQIWITGVNPGRAAPGFDPSYPAFWMPGQVLSDSNHVAYWAEYDKE
ncbi:MAG: hypothetical protein ACJAYU_002108 [Bradymonadia bacterium]|jgi:hypothetical protein